MGARIAGGRLGTDDHVGDVSTNTANMSYTMHWRSRSNPDNRGTGLDIEDGKEAATICREHNKNHPRFTHWCEHRTEETKTEEQ